MRLLFILIALCLAVTVPVSAAPAGKLLGVVVADGSPQLGATVIVTSEQEKAHPVQLLTNAHGLFRGSLVAGVYTVRVTLAGFLPTIEQHVHIDPSHTTMLAIELDSVFSSLERLRRPANQGAGTDEWSWVLRTAGATRPVLRWADGEVVLDQDAPSAENVRVQGQRGRLELTSGTRRAGSAPGLDGVPTTAFVYDQGIGQVSRLLLAGQFSYEHAGAAGFAIAWLPSGEAGRGWTTRVSLSQSRPSPAGPFLRCARLQQDDELEFGNRAKLRYGGEYILAGFGKLTSSLRPHASFEIKLTPSWRGSLILTADPWSDAESASADSDSLQSTLEQLNSAPALMLHDGRPVLEKDWHGEVAIERTVSPSSTLTAAVFRDQAGHTPVFGRGEVSGPDFFPDVFSDAFAYDAGSYGLWGARVAFQQKLSDEFKAALVYAYAGTLSADGSPVAPAGLRDALRERYRHTFAARISGHLPRLGTQLVASYEWISGQAVTRPDAFGEALYHVEPYLGVSFRQPLPAFLCCRFEAMADFHNLLAQGYVPVATIDGRTLLMPSARSFRGGVSVQF